MKRILIGIAFLITLAGAGWLAARSVAAAPTATVETGVTTTAALTTATYPGWRSGGCFRNGGGWNAAPTYEWLYLHLDETERATVDALHGELLATYDFAAMTADERLAALTTIRTALADYIVEEGFVSGVNP